MYIYIYMNDIVLYDMIQTSTNYPQLSPGGSCEVQAIVRTQRDTGIVQGPVVVSRWLVDRYRFDVYIYIFVFIYIYTLALYMNLIVDTYNI